MKNFIRINKMAEILQLQSVIQLVMAINKHRPPLCKLACIFGISKTVLERLGTIFDVMLRARGFAPTCMSKNGEGRIGELELV